jgi:hypothetical protein
MDAIECRECPADVKPIGIFTPVNIQAFFVAITAGSAAASSGIWIILQGFQLLHNYPLALFT